MSSTEFTHPKERVMDRSALGLHTDGDKRYDNISQSGFIWLGHWVQLGPQGISPKAFQDICIKLETYKSEEG